MSTSADCVKENPLKASVELRYFRLVYCDKLYSGFLLPCVSKVLYKMRDYLGFGGVLIAIDHIRGVVTE